MGKRGPAPKPTSFGTGSRSWTPQYARLAIEPFFLTIYTLRAHNNWTVGQIIEEELAVTGFGSLRLIRRSTSSRPLDGVSHPGS
jgi:hypothetical protein